jgi:alkylhydroperoxidase family enzyme
VTRAARLAPLAPDAWAAEERDLLRGHLGAADRYLTGRADAPPMPGILGIFGHHPRLAANWLALSGGMLDDPVLDPRDRELLVLRVAWRTQSRYEWAQHVRLAASAGLSPDEIAAVAGELDLTVWPERDRWLLAAADQLIDVHRVDDATWERLAVQFDERALIELLFVVGSYLCLALVLNSVGLEPDAGIEHALPARAVAGANGQGLEG